MNCAAALRRDLAERAQKFTQSEALPYSLKRNLVPGLDPAGPLHNEPDCPHRSLPRGDERSPTLGSRIVVVVPILSVLSDSTTSFLLPSLSSSLDTLRSSSAR